MSRQYHPKAGFWIRLCVAVIYPTMGVAFRNRYHHLERIPPPPRGVIIVLNHISQLDTLVMARFVWVSGRVPRFMIKSAVFGLPVVGRIMTGARQIPVYRGTADASASLKDAVSALDRGEAVVIYPEGSFTKDPDKWPMVAKTGVARLTLLSPDTPVIPVGQWGAQRRRGWHRLVPARRLAQASVGEPVDLSAYRGAEPTAEVLREITDRIMTAVRDQVAVLRGQAPPEQFAPSPRKDPDRHRRPAA